MSVRVLLVDDHTLSRKGLCALLSGDPELTVVGDTGDPAQAPELVAETRPDVVVLEVSPTGSISISSVRDVQRAERRPPVIALSAVVDEHRVAQALEYGAAGYLSSNDTPEEVRAAIRAVASGRIYVTPRITRAATPPKEEAKVVRASDPLRGLTGREREIFTQVVRGASSAGIARELGVSPRTIETHRAHLMRKLGLHCAADLVRYAARHGLLPS